MARRKRKKLPNVAPIVEALKKEFPIQLFKLQEIPSAVTWAERGNIAIHENYHSRRKQSYHVISGNKDNLIRFCKKLGINPDDIKASEFYRFWHLTWYPDGLEGNNPLPINKNQGLTYIHPLR